MSDYDVVIVGAGIAGLTAGLTAGRYGLSVAIIDQMGSGGQVLNVEKIENLPGFPQGVAGYDLGAMVQEQAEAAGAAFVFDTAEGLAREDDEWVVRCAENELRARAVIIAAGSTIRSLGIPGEERLTGKGVSHCASCDGPFFTGGEVCIVGGGDSALEEAAVLAGHAGRVRVFHRGEAFSAQKAILEEAEGKPNVEGCFNAEVVEIIGEDAVTGVRVRDLASGETRVEALAGVFVYVGLEPNTAFLQGVVDLDSTGHVVTDVMMRTSAAGVFAAGDVRQGSVNLLASVAGDGATAAV